MFELEFG